MASCRIFLVARKWWDMEDTRVVVREDMVAIQRAWVGYHSPRLVNLNSARNLRDCYQAPVGRDKQSSVVFRSFTAGG